MSDLSAAYLAQRQADPEEQDYQRRLAAAREQDEVGQSLGTFAKDVVAIGRPDHQVRNVAVAAWDMLRNTGETLLDLGRGATQVMANSQPVEQVAPQDAPKQVELPARNLNDYFPNFISAMDAAKEKANANAKGPDIFFQKAVQFAIPFSATVKGLSATANMGTVGNMLAADAAVSATVWDPHEGRFADLVRSIDTEGRFSNPVIDYLASDPNDTDAEGRFKNVMDSQLAGMAFGAVIKTGAAAVKAAREGRLFAGGPVGRSAQRGIIRPDVVLGLKTDLKLPGAPEFTDAVKNTPGAEITSQGLLIRVVRKQSADQEGEQAVRTGVFYLPSGDERLKYYTGRNGYGGAVKHEGETLVRAPLFVKGATGGKAPEAAYAQIKGKEAMAQLEADVMRVASHNDRRTLDEQVYNLLEKYGADGNMAWTIVANSKKGNQLRYAIQENIIAHAVRDAGFDSVLGYTRSKNGPVLSELFDVREQTYPSSVLSPQIHNSFQGQQ